MLLLSSKSLTGGRPISIPSLAIARMAPTLWLEGALSSDGTWRDRLDSSVAFLPGGTPPMTEIVNGIGTVLFANSLLRLPGHAAFGPVDSYTMAVVTRWTLDGFYTIVTGPNGTPHLQQAGGNGITFNSGDGSGAHQGGPDLPAGRFYLIVVSNSPAGLVVRANGAPYFNGPAAPLSAAAGGTEIGFGGEYNGGFFLAAEIHAALTFSRALSAADLATLETTYTARVAALNA